MTQEKYAFLAYSSNDYGACVNASDLMQEVIGMTLLNDTIFSNFQFGLRSILNLAL